MVFVYITESMEGVQINCITRQFCCHNISTVCIPRLWFTNASHCGLSHLFISAYVCMLITDIGRTCRNHARFNPIYFIKEEKCRDLRSPSCVCVCVCVCVFVGRLPTPFNLLNQLIGFTQLYGSVVQFQATWTPLTLIFCVNNNALADARTYKLGMKSVPLNLVLKWCVITWGGKLRNFYRMYIQW